jgi:hypothetical protein
MATRGPLVLILATVFASMGATYPTTNFVVEAPNPQLAQQAGQYAEQYRKEKAILWLGQEMPPWPERCPLKITVTMGGAGGATSFAFDRGRVLGQTMHIEGSVERLLNSVLPHEVTHTVFAYHFRCPVPRWADEGGAVLSEDDIERNRHDQLVRQILNTPGRAIPLRRLFALKEYPGDVMALYAQGFSVCNFLVTTSNRQVFLDFVAMGMNAGWDRAAQQYYHFNSVEELEQAWLTHMRNTKRQPAAQLAQNTNPNGRPAEAEPTSRVLVRQTVPPAQPFEDTPRPVFRGKATGEDDYYQQPQQPMPPQTVLQAPLPPDRWQPPAPPPVSPNAVRLMPPEFNSPPPPPSPPAQLGQALPAPVSPVGYPR